MSNLSTSETEAIGYVRLISCYDYEDSGQRVKGFVVSIEKSLVQGEFYFAAVENPLIQSLLTTALANQIIVNVRSHSTTEMRVDHKLRAKLVKMFNANPPVMPVIDAVDIPSLTFQ